MNKKLEKAQDIVLDRVNNICDKFGLNNIMAQLYAMLYLNNGALSLNDMAERLKISKGSISVNIRALERYGAVKRVWVKGSRRDYYDAEIDISKVIMDRIKSMAQSRLAEIDDMINASYSILNSAESTADEETEGVKVFKERLEKLKSIQGKMRSLFDLLNSGLVNNLLNGKAGNSDEKAVAVESKP